MQCLHKHYYEITVESAKVFLVCETMFVSIKFYKDVLRTILNQHNTHIFFFKKQNTLKCNCKIVINHFINLLVHFFGSLKTRREAFLI